MKKNIWIVLADSNSAHIYEYHDKDHQLQLIKKLAHPESRTRDQDLVSDRPGRYQANGGGHGAFVSHSDPHQQEIDKFSSEIAHELEMARTNNSYHGLVIITPPHCQGLLNKHLNSHVKNKIINTLNKDYTHLSEHELKLYFREHWQEIIKPQ